MRKLIMLTIGTVFLASCASTTPETQVHSVEVDLPQDLAWSVVSDRASNTQYIKEWVPEGEDPFSTKWIITSQKLTLGSKTSAESFQKNMFALSRQSCTNVLFNGPQELMVEGHRTSVGRIMCAQQHGKPYGTFTDQRVVVDGFSAYVITSELRIPASAKAGMLAFGQEQIEEMKQFMQRQGASARLVRESVNVSVQ